MVVTALIGPALLGKFGARTSLVIGTIGCVSCLKTIDRQLTDNPGMRHSKHLGQLSHPNP
jgi:CRISPR/Cas system CMR-associated protein Cmr1 (group 7 of RAMP superfamily)